MLKLKSTDKEKLKAQVAPVVEHVDDIALSVVVEDSDNEDEVDATPVVQEVVVEKVVEEQVAAPVQAAAATVEPVAEKKVVKKVVKKST